MDIIDLAERMENIDKADILRVFQNLLDGSENHLRAFVSAYESLTGEEYSPILLDLETYNQIINGTSDSGSNGRGRPNNAWAGGEAKEDSMEGSNGEGFFRCSWKEGSNGEGFFQCNLEEGWKGSGFSTGMGEDGRNGEGFLEPRGSK
jgi:hypothetical protein